MANEEDRQQRPSDIVAARVRAARTAAGLTVAGLAERCAKAGYPDLTVQTIYNLEGRRTAGRTPRPVTVDELIALGYALSVAPVNLLVPLSDEDPYPVTPAVTEPAFTVRQWIRGTQPLDGTDRRLYYSQVPGWELERAAQVAQMEQVRPELVHRISESEDT